MRDVVKFYNFNDKILLNFIRTNFSRILMRFLILIVIQFYRILVRWVGYWCKFQLIIKTLPNTIITNFIGLLKRIITEKQSRWYIDFAPRGKTCLLWQNLVSIILRLKIHYSYRNSFKYMIIYSRLLLRKHFYKIKQVFLKRT